MFTFYFKSSFLTPKPSEHFSVELHTGLRSDQLQGQIFLPAVPLLIIFEVKQRRGLAPGFPPETLTNCIVGISGDLYAKKTPRFSSNLIV